MVMSLRRWGRKSPIMFRRLLAWFGLPLAGLALVLTVAVRRLVDDEALRRQLLWAVLLSTLASGAALAVVCFWRSRQWARSLGELTRAFEDIGGNVHVFLAENDLLWPLARTF